MMLGELAKSTIGTRRLVLRLLRADDAAALFALFNDWEVVRWLSSPPWPYTPADAELFLRNVNDGRGEAAFAITRDNALIGTISVRDRAASHLQRGAGPNIGYWLGRPFWGEGYMTESVRALLAHLFALSRAEAIYCGAFTGNLASLRVQEKLGFAHDGETMLHARPFGRELDHVNTVLTRARYERVAASTEIPANVLSAPLTRMRRPDRIESGRRG